MKSKKLVASLVMAVMVFTSVLTGCQTKPPTNDKTPVKVDKVLDYYVGDEPQTLDPLQMIGAPDMYLGNFFLEGLTRAGKEEGKYEPGVAKSWSFDQASNTYTFVLNKDAKWSNGDPVTAQDFFFAWRLAMEDSTPYSYMISYIKGAQDYADVTKKSYLIGKDAAFKALNDSIKTEKDATKKKDLKAQVSKRIEAMTETENAEYKKLKDDLWAKVGAKEKDGSIVIQLASPVPFFVGLTAFPVFFPVNEKFYNEHKKAGDYTLEAAGLLSNGPWVVKDWKHKESFAMEKNTNYWNKDNIKIDKVNIKVVNDVATRTNLLKTGKLDGSAIQSTDLKDFEDQATLDQYKLQPLENMPDYTVFYIDFNHFSNKITQNVNIRKAMAYAMDRKTFVEKINLGDDPALALIPTHFLGLNKAFRDENGVTLFDDNQKDKAKEFLAQGLKELNLKELPAMDMLIDTGDISMKIAQKYQEDWKQIGITVNLIPVPWSEKLSRLQAGNFALCADGWGPDYLDPMTYMELFETGNGNNYGQYSNKKYDDLIEKARAEADAAKRMGYFYEAEKILMNDMVIAPDYYRVAHWTYKTYVTGVVHRGIGANTDFYWADIDMAAKNAESK
ncbi:peptide ABC transporter substrate-binding protein [Candidatus Clostridium radicumherbarum]|uniref:Peptide ABC transporter substrate-binding protein n=1 Tax=Candidatus Clostridium radicumherbarum TaxID=3381662 RepID=A0ABW8TQY1_9CLOT